MLAVDAMTQPPAHADERAASDDVLMTDEPVLIRMFVDDASGVALWPPPRSTVREQTLPMSDDLRARIQEWVNDYTEYILGRTEGDGHERALEHDRRGYALSRELQAELGDGYLVQYEPHTSAADDAQLPRQVFLFSLSAAALDQLPELPQDLRKRLLEWLAEGSRFVQGSDDTAAAQHAWEDEGLLELRPRMQRAWGPTFYVRL